ncbi:hypothetical protein C8J57DRAFT_1584989 [Mycena rebaudengoi]|nr:hypothetical protein C8J57DRAFT_1584989 [Mycena rebaudengoi]
MMRNVVALKVLFVWNFRRIGNASMARAEIFGDAGYYPRCVILIKPHSEVLALKSQTCATLGNNSCIYNARRIRGAAAGTPHAARPSPCHFAPPFRAIRLPLRFLPIPLRSLRPFRALALPRRFLLKEGEVVRPSPRLRGVQATRPVLPHPLLRSRILNLTHQFPYSRSPRRPRISPSSRQVAELEGNIQVRAAAGGGFARRGVQCLTASHYSILTDTPRPQSLHLVDTLTSSQTFSSCRKARWMGALFPHSFFLLFAFMLIVSWFGGLDATVRSYHRPYATFD